MEGVLLPGFGDVGLEGPRDVCRDERVASAEVGFQAELLLDMMEGGVLSQTGCDLSAVFNRKQAKIAVTLLEHEVVCVPYLFRGGMEREPGVGKARFGEGGVSSHLLAIFLGLRILDVGGNGGTPGGGDGRDDERDILVYVRLSIIV